MRMYEETVINPSDEGVAERGAHPPMGPMMSGGMPNTPGVSADTSLSLTWKLPMDWVEREKGSMRLASFSSGSGENMVDCSIVALGGHAGGLEANVTRWMGQINLTLASDQELSGFISGSEKIRTGDNAEGVVIDFTALQKNTKDTAPSILAVVFPFEGRNVFVKLAGPKSEILKNKNKFKEFCQSLKITQK